MPRSTKRMSHCWACGAPVLEPIRGLCFECYTLMRQPGRIGHALLEGPTRLPPFSIPIAVAEAAQATRHAGP